MVEELKESLAEFEKTIKDRLTFASITLYAVIFVIIIFLIFHLTAAGGRLTNAAYGQSQSSDQPDTKNEPNMASSIHIVRHFSGDDLEGRDLSMKTFILTMFSGTWLEKASFRSSAFIATDFSGTHLQDADLSGAAFVLTNFSGAHLQGADLSGTKFRLALFAGAHLSGANFEGADLAFANLRGINNWRQIRSIRNANVYKVKNPPEGFVEWAMENGAVSISPNEQ